VRSSDFGGIQERRLRLGDGLLVEVGIGGPSWANTEPIDGGTRQVASDGLVPLVDRAGLLTGLMRALPGG
jgi:hypothetical protein